MTNLSFSDFFHSILRDSLSFKLNNSHMSHVLKNVVLLSTVELKRLNVKVVGKNRFASPPRLHSTFEIPNIVQQIHDV